ncbi:hypothetical protein AU468_07795 [Alkalispirochaeta sphaeroplastigenens]|uniref:Uncharacterized protein n=2 Tax=Alkalispirochaeta sphaeroplastigenens TaxID=1187066 RepID=A0A2S4JQ50_9SPIO|nr:hypothetical protein AU468_07795 [Alkalispirochaeta sphaeroplastigenens]
MERAVLLLREPLFQYTSPMAEIKSALEIALEKTRDIQGDPEAVRKHEAKNEGRKMLATLRRDPDFQLKKALKAVPRDRTGWVKEGLFEAVRSNLVLPQEEADLARLEELAVVMKELSRDRAMVDAILQQVRDFFSRYLQDRDRLIEGLTEQYEPRRKQREQQLSQQYGRPVKLEASQDPEFAKLLQDHLGRLQEQYQHALVEVESHLRGMAGF